MGNISLSNAKKTKNDEFYTSYEDIAKELSHYEEHFEGKIVYCNCDNPEWSNFWKYFKDNFNQLGLKKLISTHYEKDRSSWVQIIEKDVLGEYIAQFDGNGDFRSEECIKYLKESDIVVTNPPFSLFREYVGLLIAHEKKFLVIGNQNAITYKDVFGHIKSNKLWMGYSFPKEFVQPDKSVKKFGNICWFTNLETKKRKEKLILFRKYNPVDYLKYDNYDAIEVSKVKDIPEDYNGVMGVPITFLDKHNPEQFVIIDMNPHFLRFANND